MALKFRNVVYRGENGLLSKSQLQVKVVAEVMGDWETDWQMVPTVVIDRLTDVIMLDQSGYPGEVPT